MTDRENLGEQQLPTAGPTTPDPAPKPIRTEADPAPKPIRTKAEARHTGGRRRRQ
ncbi:hypothetical protein V1638_15110 [Pseudarthrobacter sp. J64]|uniref:hypothetical protein n=1 Tax=Pseudarthrobacter sp. J64 TaxID=3116485 RepID=UPI002E813A2E|nr:hypothetical protein [Pseudarthrobacter sp. J64]MEE2570714.1 hypothetical protein [Pseudarthrobacter sp. J64]